MSTRRIRLLAIVLVLLAVVACGATMIEAPTRAATGASADRTPQVLDLDAPARVNAGEPFSVAITADTASGVVPVVVRIGASTHRFAVPLTAGRAQLRIDGPLAAQSGTMDIRARSATATVEVRPGPAVDGFTVLTGPHTVVADGADRAVAVVVPRDRHGNPVAEGTQVDFSWEQPGDATGRGSAATGGVTRLLAWVVVPSGIREGTSRVRATTGVASGVDARIVEVPGPAVAVEIAPIRVENTELGEAVALESGLIVDRFDNRLPDGVEGHFRVETASGVHIVPGVVQGARLRAWWVPEPGTGVVTATVNGVVSTPISIDIPNGAVR